MQRDSTYTTPSCNCSISRGSKIVTLAGDSLFSEFLEKTPLPLIRIVIKDLLPGVSHQLPGPLTL